MITGDRLIVRKNLTSAGPEQASGDVSADASTKDDNAYQKYFQSLGNVFKVVLTFTLVLLFDTVFIYWGTRFFCTIETPIVITGLVTSFLLYIGIKTFGYVYKYFVPEVNEAIAKAMLWPCFFICLFVLPTIYYSPTINGSANPFGIFGKRTEIVAEAKKEPPKKKRDLNNDLRQGLSKVLGNPTWEPIFDEEFEGKGSNKIVCTIDAFHLEPGDRVITEANLPTQPFRVFENNTWIEITGSHGATMNDVKKMEEEKKQGPKKFCYAIQAPEGVKIKVKVLRLQRQQK